MSLGYLLCETRSNDVDNASSLAKGLEPLYGKYVSILTALRLVTAGTTSAITAPFAAAYVVKGCLQWNTSIKSTKFRAVWMVILILGIFFSSLNIKPLQDILIAQIANDILLPLITGFLIWITSKKTIMGLT
ncbi:MAG: divalent metal cation transporter [Bacteroidota bacterium]|nr:divalent metal cation transporter [Bacteroidota bacterium]